MFPTQPQNEPRHAVHRASIDRSRTGQICFVHVFGLVQHLAVGVRPKNFFYFTWARGPSRAWLLVERKRPT